MNTTWTCSYCGKVDNTGGTCPSCGANRPQTATYTPEIMVPQAGSGYSDTSSPSVTSRGVFWGIINGCIFLFLIPFFCSGILLAVGTASEWHDQRALSQSGATTQATITGRAASSSGKNSTSYSVDYEFTFNDHTYSNSDTVDADTYNTLESGSKVT